MKIKDLYKQKKPVISFEIFPPKKNTSPDTLYTALWALEELKPDFISVTYSAGGSGETGVTKNIAKLINDKYGIESLAHLTCIGSNSEVVSQNIKELHEFGVHNIMALRGDVPIGSTCSDDMKYATHLIESIKSSPYDFCVGAAAYPEGHMECESFDLGVDHLKQKVDAGADFLVTQLFFDNRYFYDFYDKALKKGIKAPISAGIMPIVSKNQIQKMIFMCGASLPSEIVKILYRYSDNPKCLLDAAIDYAARQVDDLIANNVDGVHIYTMNRPEIARAIMSSINL